MNPKIKFTFVPGIGFAITFDIREKNKIVFLFPLFAICIEW